MADGLGTGPAWDDVVLDTSAFIQGEVEALRRLGKTLWTVPEVIQEVKDKRAKESATFALTILPEGLRQVRPKKESVDFIVEFSRKTGDYQTLSRTDILVLALTHELRQRTSTVKDEAAVLRNVKDIIEVNDDIQVDSSEKQDNSGSSATKSRPVQPGMSWAKVTSTNISATASSSTTNEINNATHERQDHSNDEEDADDSVNDSEQESPDEEDENEDEDEDLRMEPNSSTTVSLPQPQMWDDDDFKLQHENSTVTATKQPSLSPIQNKSDQKRVTWGLNSSRDKETVELSNEIDFPALKPSSASQEKTKISAAWPRPAAHLIVNSANSVSVGSADDRNSMSNAVEEPVKGEQQKQSDSSNNQQGKSRILSMTSSVPNEKKEEVEDKDFEWAKPGSSSFGWASLASASAPKRKSDNSSLTTTSVTATDNKVACSTADFACQNVLLQLGLGCITLDGRRITQVKSWVLKCDSCLRIFPVKEKKTLFCPHCGHPHLARLGFSTDLQGNRRYHYAKTRRMKTQGNIFPIPKNADMLLREDQLFSGIWAQRAQRSSNQKSMFGQDVNSAFGLDVKGNPQMIKVGVGSVNPNAQKGRERRGASKKKKH